MLNIRLLSLCLGMLVVPQVLCADSLWQIKSRMMERREEITQMKEQKLVGERFDGFLAFLPDTHPTSEQEAIVNAQNEDRKQAYTQLAAKEEKTVEEVAVAKAKELYEESPSHFMFQDDQGAWKSKN